MATAKVEMFNVKNTSVRLVHIGGVSILPEQIVAIVDDEKGINRKDVESCPFLKATKEKPNTEMKPYQAPTEPVADATAPSTPTGAGWTANP